MDNKRYFTVVLNQGEESGRYSGTAPRKAAVKVARVLNGTVEDPQVFTIRETKTRKFHTFTSYVEERPRKPGDPEWLGNSIAVAHVEKIDYRNEA